MSAEVNNNDESSDEEINENEDISVSDTEQDPIVFKSDDEEDELSFQTDSDDLGLDEDYSESEEESISLDESEDENLKKKSENSEIPSTSKDNEFAKIKKGGFSMFNINNRNISNTLQTKKQSKTLINKMNKSDESNTGKDIQKGKVQNKENLKLDLEKCKERSTKKNTESSIESNLSNHDKLVTDQQIDEYEYDSSDEEDIRNTVGNIPMKWYDEYDHIGYDWDGKKIIKPQKGDQLDNFLKRMEDPDFWRTIKDPQTGQDVVLSEADIDLITRIQKRKIPDITFDEYAVSIFLIY